MKQLDDLEQTKVDFYFKLQHIFLIILFYPHLDYQQNFIFLQFIKVLSLNSPLKGLQNVKIVQPPKTLDYLIMIFLVNVSAPVQNIATRCYISLRFSQNLCKGIPEEIKENLQKQVSCRYLQLCVFEEQLGKSRLMRHFPPSLSLPPLH